MPLDNKIAVAAVMFGIGLVILVLLWPGHRQGVRLLRRWGVAEPEEQDVAHAVRYLRRRRFWYPWLYLGLSAAGFVSQGGAGWEIVGTVLFGSLLAEILAQRPARGSRRAAVLTRRGPLDFVPLWALIVFGLATVVSVVRLAVLGRPVVLVTALVAVGLAWLIVLLAVRRPSDGRPEIDVALRTRSARVAVGLGIVAPAVPAVPAGTMTSALDVGYLVLGVVAFLAIVQPDRPRARAGAD